MIPTLNHRCSFALVVVVSITTACCGANLDSGPDVSATDPEGARVSYAHGNQLLAQGDFGGAVEAFTESISRDPSQAQTYNNRAIAYTQLGQLDLAVDDLNSALGLVGDDPEILFNLGNVQLRRGFYPLAADAFERVLQRSPGDTDAKNNLAVALIQLGDLDRAEELLHEVLSVEPDRADALGNLGTIAEQRQDTEQAMTMYRRALDVDPDDLSSLLNLGMLEAQEGSTANALEHLERFLSLAPHGMDVAAAEAMVEQLQQ